MERVRPLKLEETAIGGGEQDIVPRSLNPNEDAIETRGIYLQYGASDDVNCYIDRDGENNMRFESSAMTAPSPKLLKNLRRCVRMTRAPVYTDYGYPLGTTWIDETRGDYYYLWRIFDSIYARWLPLFGPTGPYWEYTDEFVDARNRGGLTTTNSHHDYCTGDTGYNGYIVYTGYYAMCGALSVQSGPTTNYQGYWTLGTNDGIFDMSTEWHFEARARNTDYPNARVEVGLYRDSNNYIIFAFHGTGGSNWYAIYRRAGTTVIQTATGVSGQDNGWRHFTIDYFPTYRIYWGIDGVNRVSQTNSSWTLGADHGLWLRVQTLDSANNYLTCNYIRGSGPREGA